MLPGVSNFLKGRGLEFSESKAFGLIKQASEGGRCPPALPFSAWMYHKGFGNRHRRQQDGKSLSILGAFFRTLVKNQEDPRLLQVYGSAYNLASNLITFGVGIPQNAQKGLGYLKQAADYGDVDGQTEQGLKYLDEGKEELAQTCLIYSSERGWVPAQWHLARLFMKRNEMKKACLWIGRASAQGHTLSKDALNRFKKK